MLFGLYCTTQFGIFFVFFAVLTEKKRCLAIFKTCLLCAKTLRFFSACLTFIEAIRCILTGDLAYVVPLILESLIIFF